MRMTLFSSALMATIMAGPATCADDDAVLQLKMVDDGTHRITIATDTYHVGSSFDRLPALSVRFRQAGAVLEPLDQGFIETDHSYFDWVVSRGVVESDKGRFSVPVTLVEKNANCVHNGMLLVSSSDKVLSAKVRFDTETCMYFKFDYDAQPTVFLSPGLGEAMPVGQRTDSSLPARPLSALAGIDSVALAEPGHIRPVDLSAYGAVVDGVHYQGPCTARGGIYPACEEMVLPSYSLAKSLAGGLGLMRLEKLYPGARNARVADYIPACKGEAWEGVTFEHLLNMTTGNYNSAKRIADEDSAAFADFFTAETGSEKTAFSCEFFPRRDAPGSRWVYHTSDTYLLGVAMNAFLSEKTGRAADYYRDLLAPIWRKTGFSPKMDSIRRTKGDDVPFSGYGMVFHGRDIAMMAHLLASGDAAFAAHFDTNMLRAALQRNPDDRGLYAGVDTLRYRHGFWAWNAREALGCEQDAWLPFLSGFGGISVVLLPHGDAYYNVSDGGVYAFAGAVKELSKISPICGGMS